MTPLRKLMPKIQLLLLDDQEITRLGFQLALSRQEDMALVAQTATREEALLMLDRHSVDLVLINMEKPWREGVQAVQAIKRYNPDVRVMLMVTPADRDSLLASLCLEADAMCCNTTLVEDLVAAIHGTLDDGFWLDPAIARFILTLTEDEQPENVPPKPEQAETVLPVSDIPADLAAANHFGLTVKERNILALLSQNKDPRKVAIQLDISLGAVRANLESITRKFTLAESRLPLPPMSGLQNSLQNKRPNYDH